MNEVNYNDYPSDRMRGRGRRRMGLIVNMPNIAIKLRGLVEPSICCNLQSSILWVDRSVRHLESEMNASGYEISYAKIGHAPQDLGFSQKGKKTREGKNHPDRNEQFHHINNTANSVHLTQRSGNTH
ncbi:MAG: hypothetical protein M0Z77_04775 [Thermoplasmatales archaeon]|nr:hypothetical protein [Thermoplasmatales archaeon]